MYNPFGLGIEAIPLMADTHVRVQPRSFHPETTPTGEDRTYTFSVKRQKKGQVLRQTGMMSDDERGAKPQD
jgi:hypothetical protein